MVDRRLSADEVRAIHKARPILCKLGVHWWHDAAGTGALNPLGRCCLRCGERQDFALFAGWVTVGYVSKEAMARLVGRACDVD